MARRRTKSPLKSTRRRPRERKTGNGLFPFSPRRMVGRIILASITIWLLYWQWDNITAWANSVIDDVMATFGWGLPLLIATISVLIGLSWRKRSRGLLFHFRSWAAGITLMLAVWGLFSLLDRGGDIGLAITGQGTAGYPMVLSILRITGFFFLAVVAIAPIAVLQAGRTATAWAREKIRKQKLPRLAPPTPLLPPPPPPPPTAPPTPPTTGEEKQLPLTPAAPAPPPTTPSAPEPALAPTPQSLKQVTEDVWKKYGESSGLTSVDDWKLPPIDILDTSPEMEFSEADNVKRAKLIEEALSSYGVDAKVVQINSGPTVTQFGVEPGWDRKLKAIREKDKEGKVQVSHQEIGKTRVKVERISSLANDLALALAAPSIRIEAPVPGKSIVGIEVPNTTSTMVSLRGVIETSTFQKAEAKSKLALALGKGAGGEAVAGRLERMPHLLIAGATGSGKTVCLNTIICCLLLHNPPTRLQFIMIDPKRVELTPFNAIPHLSAPVIVDTKKALSALRWLNQEMNARYQTLASAGVRNIEGYNKKKEGEEKLPYLVLIIDELADLMMTGFDEVEHILCRLAQLARATGIHLVVATQRPSVDVVTGLIKANFPTRISFAVTSQVDSRTILDGAGAEKLLGKGDMLYMPTEAGKPKRLQGCYVSDPETERLVFFWEKQRMDKAVPVKTGELSSPGKGAAAEDEEYPRDPLLETAKELAEEHKHISTSFLQRKLHIGYPRAARIMEQLEEEGFKRGEE